MAKKNLSKSCLWDLTREKRVSEWKIWQNSGTNVLNLKLVNKSYREEVNYNLSKEGWIESYVNNLEIVYSR